jgi:hypothetical protein
MPVERNAVVDVQGGLVNSLLLSDVPHANIAIAVASSEEISVVRTTQDVTYFVSLLKRLLVPRASRVKQVDLVAGASDKEIRIVPAPGEP